jgi:hypothetical protein
MMKLGFRHTNTCLVRLELYTQLLFCRSGSKLLVRRAQTAPTLAKGSPRLHPKTPTRTRDLRDGHLSEDEALLNYGVRFKATHRACVAAQIAAEAAAPPPTGPGPDPAAQGGAGGLTAAGAVAA